MKKLIIFILSFPFLLVSCNFAIPETVSVVTNANYNYSIGNISQDFNESFKTSNLFGDLETDNNKIYDFFPGLEDEKLQQYLLTIKVDDVDLDYGTIPAGTELNLDIPPVSVSLDISEIFGSIKDILGESFVNNADFREIPLYIYCEEPSGFTDSELKGKVTIKYHAEDDSDTSESDVTVGDEDTVIPYFGTPELNITSLADSEKLIDNVLSTAETSLNGDIKQILNSNKDKTGEIQLEFDLSFAGTTNGESIGALFINAFIIIPLKFDVKSIIDIDLKSLAKDEDDKSNEDVFNRTEATDTTDTKKYLDVIEKVFINYRTAKNPIVTDSNTRYVISSESPYMKKELDVNSDSVKISNEDFMEILSSYPFNPDINLNVPSGAILSLPRDVSLEMNIDISLFTNGTIKI